MTKAFKLFFFLSTIVIVVQCDREQTMETEVDIKHAQKLNILSFDALPAEIKSKIITAETELKATDTHHKALKPFGSPKFNKIHQSLGDNGSQSYTLALKKTSEGLYYDNLVINQDAEGNTRTHIIRYQPESDWYHKHKTEGLGYPHYSGDIHIFSESETLLSSVTVLSGIPVKKTTKDDTNVGHRANDQEMTCNVIDIDYVGGCAGEECWWSEIIITLNCTGAGGGSDGMYDDGGYGQGGANGPQHEGGQHGGGGSGGPVNTVPVEDDEEPPVAEENMDDQIIIDITFVNIDKINCTYQQLLKNTTLNELLTDFFGEDAEFDVVFKVEENLICNENHDAEGCASPYLNEHGKVEISISQEYINNDETPTLFLAQAIIHEAIHANLFLAVYNYENGNPVTVPDINDFGAIYEKYRQIKGWQHELMADNYINLIKNALEEVHPLLNDEGFINDRTTNFPDWNWDAFYTNIAWIGLLKNTTAGQTYLSNPDNAENLSLYHSSAKADATKIPNCD